MTAAQCRAARGLLEMSTVKLSGVAMVPHVVLMEFEAGLSMLSEDDLDRLRLALERTGVEFTNGDRPGVRLRK